MASTGMCWPFCFSVYLKIIAATVQGIFLQYDEFKNHVEENIKGFLDESYENASVQINTVIKNNGRELDALQIRKERETITPSIYLNDIFKN